MRREPVGLGVRRRPRVPRPVGVALVLLAVVVAYLGFAAAGADQGGPAPRASEEAAVPQRPGGADVDRSARAEPAGVFARVDGLELVLPHAEPAAVAFHEASQPDAMPLTPVGVLEGNDNPDRFERVADEPDGPGYHVLAPHQPARAATGAVDVALPAGTTVRSPVDGTVVETHEYVHSGSVRDWRVVLEPEDRPGLHIVIVHLHEPALEAGDRVERGRTALANVRGLTTASRIDRIVGGPVAFVRLEVRPAGPPEPLDPNAPALPTEAP